MPALIGAHGQLPHAEHIARCKGVHLPDGDALRRRVTDAVFGDIHLLRPRLQEGADIRKVIEMRMRDENGVCRRERIDGNGRLLFIILSYIRIDEDARISAREHQRRRSVPCDLHASHRGIV